MTVSPRRRRAWRIRAVRPAAALRLSVPRRRLSCMRGTPEHARCTIIPPYLLRALAESNDPEVAACAVETLERDATLRARRQGLPGLAPAPALAARASTGARWPRRTPARGLRRPRHRTAARHRRAPRGRASHRRPCGRRGLRRSGRDLGAVLHGLRPQLPRRPRAAAPGHGALRPRLRQRLLGRQADGVRRRRRALLPALHRQHRRHRARARPRRHRVHRGPDLPRPVRGAQRERLRRLRLARAPARAGAARRRGRLAHRRRACSPTSCRGWRCAR